MNGLLPALAGGLTLVSGSVYVTSILRGQSRPHRTTHFVLLVITALTAAAVLSGNDATAIWLAAGSCVQAVVVFAMSIKYGMGGWSPLDIVCLGVALAGIAAWQVSGDAMFGLSFAIAGDFAGMIPSLVKTWRWPHTEAPAFYVLDTIAGVIVLGATPHLTMEAVAYPGYIVAINAAMAALALRRYRAQLPVASVRD